MIVPPSPAPWPWLLGFRDSHSHKLDLEVDGAGLSFFQLCRRHRERGQLGKRGGLFYLSSREK